MIRRIISILGVLMGAGMAIMGVQYISYKKPIYGIYCMMWTLISMLIVGCING